ncbi:UvrD-helicase domain-containing protein [Lysobacter sp. Hz 25]|uniref:UvrD-helicase domain-containing protein n=1 Tax=Lysobacter sp. Hz 25 TaxID=3383698 RepID=UPI0038D4070E
MRDYKYIFVDSEAAEDIVQDRFLQSEDFEQGKAFAAMLIGESDYKRLTTHTHVIDGGEGIFILNDKSQHSNFLVIDIDAAPIFHKCTYKDSITRFQKLLRFARRRWTKVSPASNEKIISGSTKAVIFPYPINTQSSIRISVELAPDKQRREKRSKGIELLAYRIGTDEGDGPNEVASVTNFRKAIESLPKSVAKLDIELKQAQPQPTQIESLSVTRLKEGSAKGTIAGCNFDEWGHYLTTAQKDFINQRLSAPHRIEGPAGTGKTLSLVLKCVAQIRLARARNEEHRSIFIAHSEATKKNIQSMFEPEIDTNNQDTNMFSLQSVKVTTLHELCSELLRYEISESELLDRDAFESKQSQLLYAIESLQEVISTDLNSHRPHMSAEYVQFLGDNDEWLLAEMLQHEISVMIKGRADEDLAKYKRLSSLPYGLPARNEGDKSFTFLIFNAYQRRLRASGQFDTDDVVLSALQQLSTPIWRRRREKEGYDSIFVDETHLFNINELSIFHRLTRNNLDFPIAYSADISQSLGDRGWSQVDFDQAMFGASSEEGQISARSSPVKFSSIFRCAPSIVDLAFSVTSAGATLFTNFDNPLSAASSTFTETEEKKCQQPQYLFSVSDDAMLSDAFSTAEKFVDEMESTRGDVAIIIFGNELYSAAEREAKSANKPIELLKHRGDMEVVRRARSSGRFILTTPDYVGGLEFDAVVLVGVDKGRVPPRFNHESADSENFISYATHQRLYVAITRAKYRVAILGVKARGASEIFSSAISHGVLATN